MKNKILEKKAALNKSVVRNKRGQSTVEYILILAVVVMIAIKFKDSMGGRITGIVDKLGSDIESKIQN